MLLLAFVSTQITIVTVAGVKMRDLESRLMVCCTYIYIHRPPLPSPNLVVPFFHIQCMRNLTNIVFRRLRLHLEKHGDPLTEEEAKKIELMIPKPIKSGIIIY